MQTHTILIILGAVLLLAGIMGGGLSLKEVKLPSLDLYSRGLAGLAGLAFIAGGIYLERDARNPTEQEPERGAGYVGQQEVARIRANQSRSLSEAESRARDEAPAAGAAERDAELERQKKERQARLERERRAKAREAQLEEQLRKERERNIRAERERSEAIKADLARAREQQQLAQNERNRVAAARLSAERGAEKAEGTGGSSLTESAPPTAAARAAPSGTPAGSPGSVGRSLPAVGTTWTYRSMDKQYGLSDANFTVTITRAAKQTLEESFEIGGSGSGNGSRHRKVDIRAKSFLSIKVGGGTNLIEFAPYYYLVARDSDPSRVEVDATGYPRGSGNPDWVARLASSPRWETVKVPAGTYRALTLEFDGRRVRLPFTSIVATRFSLRVWYAPEVRRYVKLERREWRGTNQSEHEVVELVKFASPS